MTPAAIAVLVVACILCVADTALGITGLVIRNLPIGIVGTTLSVITFILGFFFC